MPRAFPSVTPSKGDIHLMEHVNPPNLLTWGVSGRYLRAAGVLWSSLSVVLKVGVTTRIWVVSRAGATWSVAAVALLW